MQEKMDESRKRELGEEKNRYLSERERELSSYKQIIEKQESELNAYRSRLKKEQYVRENELRKEFEERERYFIEREKKLIERQKEFEEHVHRREIETGALRNHLQNEIASRESELKKAFLELEQEKERLTEESRRKLEQTSKGYVTDALELLSNKESQFHTMSKIWSGIGAGSLVLGVVFFVIVTFKTSAISSSDVTWQFLVFTLFKGLIAVGLLAGIAKYAYMFSSSYMQESLKNADRRHAINFGKFYLESYGAAANWAEVKEAFEHWNIEGTNAFSRHESKAEESNALEKAIDVIEKAEKSFSEIKDKIKS